MTLTSFAFSARACISSPQSAGAVGGGSLVKSGTVPTLNTTASFFSRVECGGWPGATGSASASGLSVSGGRHAR